METTHFAPRLLLSLKQISNLVLVFSRYGNPFTCLNEMHPHVPRGASFTAHDLSICCATCANRTIYIVANGQMQVGGAMSPGHAARRLSGLQHSIAQDPAAHSGASIVSVAVRTTYIGAFTGTAFQPRT